MNTTYSNQIIHIKHMLEYGPLSPTTIMKIVTDLKRDRKLYQYAVQIGLEQGVFHLDIDMHIALGPSELQRKHNVA